MDEMLAKKYYKTDLDITISGSRRPKLFERDETESDGWNMRINQQRNDGDLQ
eukprot:CAMPEP_0113630708 /NCGR_PEP_ID=MMETSP0017_2-20120614/15956_1 /TAXON_ID=2856 /ORGANISM="Cylindrotheca closterium" /LENGTH=51 /DNA_ID=CAMNT_0000541185 /DNA_START=36 /DNA_END=191 /DNA_ORIENTATION=+ /assembly_acc=CAM_ASM_000147